MAKSYHGFKFNNCGVCLNPNIHVFSTRKMKVSVTTARNKKGRWVAGFTCDSKTGYFSSPCSLDVKEAYNSENIAIVRIINLLLKSDFCRIIFGDLRNWRENFRIIQLSIFDIL